MAYSLKIYILAVLALAVVAAPQMAAAQTPAAGDIVINEIDYDDAGGDDLSFIELYNTHPSTTFDLTTIELVGANGDQTTPNEYGAITLSGTLAPGAYHLVHSQSNSGGLATTPDDIWGSNPQNGAPDGVFIRVLAGGAIIDSVSYEGTTSHPAGSPDSGNAGTDTADATSLSRFGDGADTGDNAADFSLQVPSPGAANPAPASTATLEGAYSFNDEIVANFDVDPGAVVAGDFTYTDSIAGVVAFTGISGTGTVRRLSTGAALTGDNVADDLAVAATAGTNAGNVALFVYPSISAVNDGTVTSSLVGVRGVTVTGVRTASAAGFPTTPTYAVADAAGANNGIFVNDTTNTPSIGDVIEIGGALPAEATTNDVLEIQPSDFSVTSTGSSIAPTVVAAGDFQFNNTSGSNPAEQYEGVLIQINNLTNAADGGFEEVDFDEGVHTDDLFYDVIGEGDLSFGADVSALVGVGHFSFGEYKVLPTGGASVPVELSSFGLE